jgi:tryptophan halogenase
MAAAALARAIEFPISIQLIESDEIGTVGVGEATVPHLRSYNASLQIDEVDFVRAVQGTFKLGIQFVDWGSVGSSYVHGFGTIGHEYRSLPFHQYWIKLRRQGKAHPLDEYSLNAAAAPAGKFMSGASDVPAGSPLAQVAYAYHFDAGLYARYLRRYAEARGVRRIEGEVIDVRLKSDGDDGFVDLLALKSGQTIGADLFIDCSGFRGLLIESALKTGYEDWSRWLPCDRAVAVPSERTGPATPYTRSTARDAGWQWRIPLQHRTGNGYVYSSAHLSDEAAASTLLRHLDGRALADPRVLRFTAGRRRRMWNGNCVALGLASGFLEPLESTSIHLIQSAIARLMFLFPGNVFDQATIDKYNDMARVESEEIRDFLVLHYTAIERDDTPFWRHCRAIKKPDSLLAKWEMYERSGNIVAVPGDLFREHSWFAVYSGQNVIPSRWHPFADIPDAAELERRLNLIAGDVRKLVATFPAHDDYLRQYCAAPPLPAGKAM